MGKNRTAYLREETNAMARDTDILEITKKENRTIPITLFYNKIKGHSLILIYSKINQRNIYRLMCSKHMTLKATVCHWS